MKQSLALYRGYGKSREVKLFACTLKFLRGDNLTHPHNRVQLRLLSTVRILNLPEKT